MDGSRLPTEVCECVMDFLGFKAYPGYCVDYGTLRDCSLVCKTWHPRARFNLLFRVTLRSARQLKLFLDVAANGPQPREMDLILPLRTAPRRGRHQTEASLASPLLTAATRGVRVLSLSYSEWLYPRTYIGLLSSHFVAVTTLDLDYVRFATGGDLARLVWSLPNLRDVHFGSVIVFHGGMLRLPIITPRVVPCRQIVSLRPLLQIDGCSSMAPFIIRTVAAGSSRIEDLSMRSSFARWVPDEFETLSAFVGLRMLRIVFASPTVFSPLPVKSSLLEVYSQSLRRILSAIASPNTDGGLRQIHIVCEPGSGPWRYLCGDDQAGEYSEEDVQNTYEQKRSIATGLLLEGIEDVFLDEENFLRRPFAGLRALNICLWNTHAGKDDDWWCKEISRRIPTLHSRGVLSTEVIRTEDEHPLWNDEDS
ncbi:hypothetical protein C8Q80DRAFT_1272122 [Daedaleopsis nitida]|nr:hypothetical protein C8Q80DRAFT_1272122 [Daedaleopsis nitida]